MEEEGLSGLSPGPRSSFMVQTDRGKNLIKELFLRSTGQNQEVHQGGSPRAGHPHSQTVQSTATPRANCKKHQRRNFSNVAVKSNIASPLAKDGKSRVNKEAGLKTVIDIENEDVQLKINILQEATSFKGDISTLPTDDVFDKQVVSDTEVDVVNHLTNSNQLYQGKGDQGNYSDFSEQKTNFMLNRRVRNSQERLKQNKRLPSDQSSSLVTQSVVHEALSIFIDSPSSAEVRRRSAPKKGKKRKSTEACLPDGDVDGTLFSTPSPHGSQAIKPHSILSSSKKRKHGSGRKKVRFAENLCEEEGVGASKKLNYDQRTDIGTNSVCSFVPETAIELTRKDSLMKEPDLSVSVKPDDKTCADFQQEDNKSVKDNCSSPHVDGYDKRLKEKATKFVQDKCISVHDDGKILKEEGTKPVQDECVGLHADSNSGRLKEENNKLVQEKHIIPHPDDNSGKIKEKGIGPVKDKWISPHAAEPADGEQSLFESQPDEQFQSEICHSNIVDNIQPDISCNGLLKENSIDASCKEHSDQLTRQNCDFLSIPNVTKVLSTETEQSPVQGAAHSQTENVNSVSLPKPNATVCESSVSTPVRPRPAMHDEMFSQISPSSLTEMCLVASSDQSKLNSVVNAQEPLCSTEAHRGDAQKTLSDVITDSAALYQHSMEHVDKLVMRTSSAQTSLPQVMPRVTTSSDGSCVKCPDKQAVSVPTENERSTLSHLPGTDMHTSSTDIISSKGEALKSENLPFNADRSSLACTGHTDATDPYVQNLFTKKPKAKRFFYPTSSQIKAVCPKTVLGFKGCDVDAKESAAGREAEAVASAGSFPNVDNTSVVNDVGQTMDCAATGGAGVVAVAGVGVDEGSTSKDGAADVKEAGTLPDVLHTNKDIGVGRNTVTDPQPLTHKKGTMTKQQDLGFTKFSEMFDDSLIDWEDWDSASQTTVLPDGEPTSKSAVLSHGFQDTTSETAVPADGVGEPRTTPKNAVSAHVVGGMTSKTVPPVDVRGETNSKTAPPPDVGEEMTSKPAVSDVVGGETTPKTATPSDHGGDTTSKTAVSADVGGEMTSKAVVSPDSVEHMTSKTDVPAESGGETTFQAVVLTDVGGHTTLQQAVQANDDGYATSRTGVDGKDVKTHENEALNQSAVAVSGAVKQNASVVHELSLKDDGQEQDKACSDVASGSHWVPSSQYVHNLVRDVQEELFSDIEFSQVDGAANETTDVRIETEEESYREGRDDSLHYATGNKKVSNSLSEKVLSVSVQSAGEPFVESEASVSGSIIASAMGHQGKDVFKKPDVPGKASNQKALVFSDSDTDALLSDMDLSESCVKDKVMQLDSSAQGCRDMSSTDASDFESCQSESDVMNEKKFNVNQTNCAADSSLSDSDTDLYVTSTEEIKELSSEVKHQAPRTRISTRSRISRKNSVLLSKSLMIGDSDSDVSCERIIYKNRNEYHFEMLPKKEPKLVNESDPDILWSGLESHGRDITKGGPTDGIDCHKDIKNIEFVSDAVEVCLKRDQTDTTKMGNDSLTLEEAKSPASVTMKEDNKQKPDRSNRAGSISGSESVWSDLEQGEAEILEEETVGVSFVTERAKAVTVSSASHQFVAVDEEVQIKTVLKDERPETGEVRPSAESQGSVISLSEGKSLTRGSNLPLMNIDSEQSTFRDGDIKNQKSARPPKVPDNLDSPQIRSEHGGVELPETVKTLSDTSHSTFSNFRTDRGHQFIQEQKSLQKATALLESEANMSRDIDGSFLTCSKTDTSKTGFSTASGKRFSFDPKSLQKATALLETDVNVSKVKHNMVDIHNLPENVSSKGIKHAVTGFSTASGKKFSFDPKSLQKATALLETDVMSEGTNISKPFSKSDENINTPNISQNVVSGFSTASGKKFNFDPKSLQKATALLETDVNVSKVKHNMVDIHNLPENVSSKGIKHAVTGFSTASGKKFSFDPKSLQKATALLETDVMSEGTNISKPFSKSDENINTPNISQNVVSGFSTASGKKFNFDPKSLQKATALLETDVDMSEVVDTNQEKVIPGRGICNSNSHSRRHKTHIDVADVTASCIADAKSNLPSFATASSKDLFLNKDSLVKAQTLMEMEAGLGTDVITPNDQTFKRIPDQGTSKAASNTVPLGGCELESILEDLLKSKKSTLEKHSKDGESQSEDLNLLSHKSVKMKTFEDVLKTSANSTHQPIGFRSPSSGFSSDGKKGLQIVSNKSMKKGDPMLKPKGFRPFKKPRIVPKPKTSDTTSKHMEVNSPETSDTAGGGQPAGQWQTTPGDSATKENTDSELCDMMLLEFSHDMTELSQDGFQASAPKDPIQTGAKRHSQADDTVQAVATNTICDRDNGTGSDHRVDTENYVSRKVSSSNENHKAEPASEPCDSYNKGKTHEQGAEIKNIKSCPFSTASGKNVTISEEALMSATSLMGEGSGNTDCQALLEEELFRGDMSSQLDVRAVPAGMERTRDGRHEVNAHVSDSGREAGPEPDVTSVGVLADVRLKGTGFQTASGRQMCLSEDSLRHAKAMWDDLPVSDTKANAASEENAANHNRKMLNVCSEQDHMVPNICHFESKCEVKDTEVDLRTESTVASSTSIDQEALTLSCGNQNLVARDVDDMKMSSNPFQTASGKVVSVSVTALNQARKVMSECRDMAEVPEEPSVRNLSDAKHVDKAAKEDEMSLSSLFQTASGKGVTVSESSLLAAKKTLCEDSDSKPPSLFQTASGKGVTVSESSLLAAKKTLCEDSDSKPPSLFQTASGKGVTVSESSLSVARKTLSENVDSKPPSLFQTASGKGVTVSESSLLAAKKTLSEDFDSKPPSLFQTASGKGVTVSESSLLAAKKTLCEDFDSKPPSLFQTASGKGVTVDKQSLDKAKKLMKDAHETQFSTTPSSSLFQTASGNTVTVSEHALVKSREIFTDEHSKQASLFKTASGTSVSVSSDSLDHAKSLFNETVDGTCTESSTLISTSNTALGSNVFGEHNSPQTSHIIQTASGPAVGVSANGLVEAQRLLQDDQDSSAVLSKSLFQTASGSCVGVSTEALAQGRRLLGEVQEPPTALATSGHGFQTALGRGVLVSESSMESSRKLLDEASEDNVVPELEVHQTGSHEELLTTDEQRRFGHRCRSKTPMMSSPESTHLDRLVKGGRRLQPIMSTSLNTTPRSDDYDLDAILNKSSEKRTSNTTSSFKTPYKNTAFVTPVRKASDQDKRTPGNSSKTPVFYPRASLRANQKQARNSPTNHNRERLELARHDSCGMGPSGSNTRSGSGTDNTSRTKPSIASLRSGEDISGRASPVTMEDSSQNAMSIDDGQQQFESVVSDLKQNTGCVWVAGEDLVFQPGKISSVQAKEIVSTSIDLKHHLEEARQKQGEIIQRKKKQKVRPSCGRLFSEKQSAGMRLQYRDLMVEGSLSDQELCSMGVRQEIPDISSNSAEDFRFNLLLYYPNMTSRVLVGDGAHLLPDNSGFAGKEEFYRSFISLESVDPALVSDIWVYNHFRWIVWKLAAYETSYPAQFSGRCLTPNNVMLQLKYRYDREVDRCHRSALKKIVERDDAACKRLVLCVSGIKMPQTGPVSDGTGQCVVELTDGWYHINGQLDVGLAGLVATKKISVGQKICVSGAELTGSQEACPPLEIPESLYLKICMNSTRPAPGDSKLGYQHDPRPLCVPISTLHAEGGVAGCVDVVVTRIYPVMYMEKLVEGGTVFRTEEAEERMQRQFDRHKQDKMEKLYTEIQAGLEKDLGRGRRKSRKRWSQREVEDLQTGQEIYDVVEGSLQPEEVHSWLTEHQAQMMDNHRRHLQDLQHQQLQDKLHTAWEEAQQGHTSRNVTPVLKLRVSGCAKRDVDAKISSIVTVWRPNPEWLHLVEGKRYKIYGLVASSAKTRLDSHSVHLTANRQTKLQPRPVDENYLDLVYDQREVWSVKDLRSRSPPFKEFDFVGMVITSKSNSQRSCDTVYVSDIDGEILSIRFWTGLQSFGLEDHLVAGKSIVATNLILKWSRGSVPVSADACSEVTRFSSTTKIPDHRKCLARFTSFKQAEKSKFLAAARERLSDHERKAQAPTTQLATPEKYFSDLPSECLQKLFSPMEDQGEKLSKGDNPATPDPVVKKRRSILREKSAKLMAYGSPRPLSPISCPVSPALARAFKLPSGLAKNMKDSFK